MTVDFAHTYTDPPQRVSTELSGGGASQDLFQRVQALLDQLPELVPRGPTPTVNASSSAKRR